MSNAIKCNQSGAVLFHPEPIYPETPVQEDSKETQASEGVKAKPGAKKAGGK